MCAYGSDQLPKTVGGELSTYSSAMRQKTANATGGRS